jgi:hypothetical protein
MDLIAHSMSAKHNSALTDAGLDGLHGVVRWGRFAGSAKHDDEFRLLGHR